MDTREQCNPFNLIDWCLTTNAKLNKRKPSSNFYPSEASVIYTDKYSDTEVGGSCLRKSWYRINGYEGSANTAKSEWIFRQGHNFEDNVADIIAPIKKKFDADELPEEELDWLRNNPEGETPFKWIDFFVEGSPIIEAEHKFFVDIHGCPIKGSIDFIMGAPESSTGQTLVELKTAHGWYAAREIFGNTRQVGVPKLGQLLQAFLYLVAFDVDGEYDPKMIEKDADGKDIVSEISSPYKFDDAWMLYFLRDDATRGPHYIQLHKENGNIYPKVNGEPMKFFGFNEVIERYQTLKKHLELETPPPKDFERQFSTQKIEAYYAKGKLSKKKYADWQKNIKIPGHWNCDYCSYSSHCKLDNR